MSETYLITGAAGHLGTALTHILPHDRIRAFVLPGETMPEDIETCTGNTVIQDTLEPFFRSIDPDRTVLIHCAAKISIASAYDPEVRETNITGTRNVMDLCLKYHLARVIHVASVHAVPVRRGIMTEPAVYRPDKAEGQYARSKAAAAALVMKYAERGLPVSIVLPSGIIGPYDTKHTNHMNRIIYAIAGHRLNYVIDGAYDFVDVRDIARGILACIAEGKPKESYILNGHILTMRALVQQIQNIAGSHRPVHFLPSAPAEALAPIAEPIEKRFLKQPPLFTPYSVKTLRTPCTFSHAKAAAAFGYQPRDIHETLAAML